MYVNNVYNMTLLPTRRLDDYRSMSSSPSIGNHYDNDNLFIKTLSLKIKKIYLYLYLQKLSLFYLPPASFSEKNTPYPL